MNALLNVNFPDLLVLVEVIALVTLMFTQEVAGERLWQRSRRLHRAMILCIILLYVFFIWVIIVQINRVN